MDYFYYAVLLASGYFLLAGFAGWLTTSEHDRVERAIIIFLLSLVVMMMALEKVDFT